MKKIFAIVTLLVSLLVAVSTGFTATAFAAGQQYPSFVDGAALVQPVDKTKLLSKLREIESKHGIRCAVLTVKTTYPGLRPVRPGPVFCQCAQGQYPDGYQHGQPEVAYHYGQDHAYKDY